MTVIDVQHLSMTYKVPVRAGGLKASLKSLFKREYRYIHAVKNIHFQIEHGEVVGFLGPNGAGKTTTLKMLCGILHPTSGEAKILGHIPWLRESVFLKQIAMIRGSRPIAVPGELTVQDALLFQKKIYDVPDDLYKKYVSELIDMLDLHKLLPRQVRALSLGERMRSGLAWSLLYRPKVLFLDEPTLGLDVSGVNAMRKFVNDYSQTTGATVILTSHYMADVKSLCKRVILINQGEIKYDGSFQSLYDSMSSYKHLRISFTEPNEIRWEKIGYVVNQEANSIILRVPRNQVAEITHYILSQVPAQDFLVEEPPLEEVMEQIFKEGVGA